MSSHAPYYELLIALAASRGLDPPERLAAGDAFSVATITFAFGLGAQAALLLYADYGATDSDEHAATDYQLLRQNYLEFATRNASFCHAPDSHRVVYAQVIEPASQTVAALSSLLERLVALILRWREDNAIRPAQRPPRPAHRHLSHLLTLSKALP